MNLMRAQHVVWEELAGGALLVNRITGARWSLNATAAAVWELCDGSASPSEIAPRLARPCEEVLGFCRQFVRMGLLTSVISQGGGATFQMAMTGAPSFKAQGLGSGPRRRPSPRGVSGPV